MPENNNIFFAYTGVMQLEGATERPHIFLDKSSLSDSFFGC